MKTIMIIIICMLAGFGFSQDRLSRIGLYNGGGVSRKPTQESVVKALSVETPVELKATSEQFEKYCLDSVVLDAETRAVYVKDDDGFRRSTGSGNTHFKVMQRISPGFFLASAGERFIAIRTDGDALMDDSSYALPLAETGETYSYTTVLGAGKRVAVYTRRPPVTKEQIMERFKAGEAFLFPLSKTTTTPCIHCHGDAFVDEKMPNGHTRKTLCPACSGKRKVTITCELIHSISIAAPVPQSH